MILARGRVAPAALGFTLIEVLAVVGLLSLVFLVAIDFYLDLSRSTRDGAELTRNTRRALAVLDRVARDLESAFLLQKPPEVDPLEHPWLFLAEGGDGDGAERIKLVSLGHRPRSDQAAESDLEMVAWMLGETETDAHALLRWSSPRLPEGLDRSFPRTQEEGALLVAEGVESFGIRLLSENGEWKNSWDSSALADSGRLPVAAEITLAFAEEEGESESPEGHSYTRRVLLPLRALEPETLLAPGGVAGFLSRAAQEGESDATEDETGEEGEEDLEELAGLDENEEDENCVTVWECFARHPEARANYQKVAGVDPLTFLGSIANECFSRYESLLRQVSFYKDFGADLSDCL